MSFFLKILEIFYKAKSFITEEIWNIRLDDFPKHTATLLKQLRIALYSFRRFNEDKIQLRASSLTYYSLLALVPILAMGFGIAKGFGFDKDLEQRLIENFVGQEEVLKWILSFVQNLLDNTKGGLIAGVGLAILMWSVMKMMGNIENSFNDIWQVKKGRSYVRKFTNYLSMMLIAPVFIFLASSGSVFVATQLDNITSGIHIINVGPFVVFLMRLFPFLMTWILFTILYIALPNTRVEFLSALMAGVIAGTIFLFVQWFYIYAQMGMSRYNVIYGSFAALPLLLFWLRASWLIVLLGAELSFARQNIDQYELNNETSKISQYENRAYNMVLLETIIKRFIDDLAPLTAKEIAAQMKMPQSLVQTSLAELMSAGLVFEVATANKDTNKEYSYSPSKTPDRYTIKYVVERLDKNGSNNILKNPPDVLNQAFTVQENILETIKNAPENILIQNLSDYKCKNQTNFNHV